MSQEQQQQQEFYSQVQVKSVDNSKPDASIQLILSTNLPNYSHTHYQFTRSLSEFDTLFTSLCKYYPHYILPCPAFVSQDEQFIRETTQVFMDSVFSHSQLRKEPVIQQFIESEFHFTPPPSPKLPWRRKASSFFSFASSSQSVKEIDVFFEQTQTKSLDYETCLMAVGKSNDQIAHLDSEPTRDVAMKWGTLQLDLGNSCGPMLRKLAKFWQNLHELDVKSTVYRQTTLNDELILSIRNVQSVLRALDYRFENLVEYDTACKTTQKKLMSIEKMRSSVNIKQDKVDMAIDELAHVKKLENVSREIFKTSSDIVRQDCIRAKYDQEIHIQGFLARYAHFHLELARDFLCFLEKIEV